MTKNICCSFVLSLLSSLSSSAADITVAGTQNPWLITANPFQPDGDRPALFTDFQPLDALHFSATGTAAFSPGLEADADGNEDFPLTRNADTHIAGISEVPGGALIGVFVEADDPASAGSTPSALDFSTPALRNYSTLSPALRQPFFIGDGRTSGGSAQTVVAPAGATRLFLGVMDRAGWAANSGSFQVSVTTAVPPSIAPITGFSYRTLSPIVSSNPFEFTATEPSVVSDLRLRVQYSFTPSVEQSWTDLPVGSQMSRIDNTWSATATDLPTGVLYFRAIAAAPGFPDQVSLSVGPVTVLPGIAPFGDFSYQTTAPARTGALWSFTIDEPETGAALRVQSSLTPEVESSWQDLAGGGVMARSGNLWTLRTSAVPAGNRWFRVIAAKAGLTDRPSALLGPIQVQDTLPTVTKSLSASGKYSLTSLSDAQEPPEMILAKAVGEANIHFALGDNAGGTAILAQAMVLYAEALARVDLTIAAGESLTTPGLNVGPNGTLVLQGTVHGDVALLGAPDMSLISNDGGSLISNDGGSLGYDAASNARIAAADLSTAGNAPVIGNDSASVVSVREDGLISNDGASIISTDGASLPAKHSPMVQAAATTPVTTGVMTIDGNYLQNRLTALTVALRGTNAAGNEYDRLIVSGRADLGGTIAFGLFPPTAGSNVFTPQPGDYFDVVEAKTIDSHDLLVRGPIWGDGLHFRPSVVNTSDGRQALRLTAIHLPPPLAISLNGPTARVAFPTNYLGFTLEKSARLGANWTPVANGTNLVTLPASDSAAFFRLKR